MRGQRHSEGEAVVDAAMALGKANGQRPKRTSWLPDGQQLCQLAVGCNDVATLQALASKFLSIISAEVESCLSRKKGPRATIRLCSLLKSFLIHLHMRPSQLKAFTRPRYEDLVAALLSYYIDLSFEVSNANASVAFLSNVVTTVNLALGHSPRHIVETLLQLKKDPTEKWDELYPLLKRVMANSSPITQSPSDFMKTIVLIKQWLNYGSTQHHRRIRKLCVSLTPPAGLDEWLGSHGFKQLSTGLKEPSVSVGEYLLSDQLTAKGCTRLLDMVCNTEDASLLSPPSFPSVAHAPKASEPPPCFFVLDTQPDRQALMEDSVPTGDDNCEQLYRALDSTIEAMDLDTGWRFGLGDGDMDDDADFCPLQFHLDNSIEQNGFDVTPPKNEPSRSSPEEGKLALGIEMNVGEAMTEDAQSRSVLSPSVIKSSDRSRRKSNISSRSADANPEPASQSSLAQRSGPGSSQKPDVSSKPGCLDCDKSPSVCHSTKRSGRRKSSVLDADEGIGLTSTEDVVRELFSSRGEQRRRRTSSHLSEETGSSEVKEVVVSSPRRNKNIDCQKLNRKGNDVLPESAAQSSKPSRKSLDTGRKSDYCNTSVRTYTETTANDPPPRSNNVRRKSASNQPTSDDIRSPAQSPSDRKTTRRKRSTDSSIGSGSPQKAVAKRSNGVTLRLSKKMRSLSPIRPFGESKSPIFPSGGSKSPVLSSGELKSKFSDKEDLIASTNSLVLRNKGRRKRDADSSGLPDPSSSQKLAQLCARVSPLPKKAKHSMTNSNSPQNKEPQVTTPRRSLQPSAKLELNASPSIKQTVSSRNLQCSTTSPRKRTDSPSDQDSGLLVRSVVTKRRSQEVVGKAASVSPRRTAKISSKQSPSKTPTAPSGGMCCGQKDPSDAELLSPRNAAGTSPLVNSDVRLQHKDGCPPRDARQTRPQSVPNARCLACRCWLGHPASPPLCHHCQHTLRCQVRLTSINSMQGVSESCHEAKRGHQCIACKRNLLNTEFQSSSRQPDNVCGKCFGQATSCFVVIERLSSFTGIVPTAFVPFDSFESSSKNSVHTGSDLSVSLKSENSTVFMDNDSSYSLQAEPCDVAEVAFSPHREACLPATTLVFNVVSDCISLQDCSSNSLARDAGGVKQEMTVYTGANGPLSTLELLQLVKEMWEKDHSSSQLGEVSMPENCDTVQASDSDDGKDLAVRRDIKIKSQNTGFNLHNTATVRLSPSVHLNAPSPYVRVSPPHATKSANAKRETANSAAHSSPPSSTNSNCRPDVVALESGEVPSARSDPAPKTKPCLLVLSDDEDMVDDVIVKGFSRKSADTQRMLNKISSVPAASSGMTSTPRGHHLDTLNSCSPISDCSPISVPKSRMIIISDDEDEDLEIVMPSDSESVNMKWDQSRSFKLLALQPSPYPPGTPFSKRRRHSTQDSCSTTGPSPVIPLQHSMSQVEAESSPREQLAICGHSPTLVPSPLHQTTLSKLMCSGRIAKVRRHPKTSPPKIISNFSLRQKYRLRSRQQLKR